jgi:hypothetical protein
MQKRSIREGMEGTMDTSFYRIVALCAGVARVSVHSRDDKH